MSEPASLDCYADETLRRLVPRLEERFAFRVEEGEWEGYLQRVYTHFPRLFALLHGLYGHEYDFFYYLDDILGTATKAWIERSGELKALDGLREADPHWYQSHRVVGAMAYVDLFAGDLAGLRERIPYLIELGVTYLHLMPLFHSPEGDDDGGYAVSSYREVDPKLGSMEELGQLATELRRHGISLVLDFVFNHTTDEHEWAQGALAGKEEYQEYYRMFPDRTMPDAFERTVRPIFPDEHPGSFTYRSRIRRWVWTSFHNYQWDLNYENPAVFNAMAREMLFLANQGVEVLRLDAVAFLWKRLGTSCENLPEAHALIRAFNAVAKIAAPALEFKSEAIVQPDEVARYIDEDECPLSYNPNLMALLWEALATREVKLLHHSMRKRFAIAPGCAWVDYVRCHDDIGWAFSDEDAREIGIDPVGHRRFLTDFYTGRFPGSFARGLPFQEDPATGDARVSGTAASLCGLEKAEAEGDETERELAVRRLALLHGILFTIGGVPLLYLGDEIGTLNDYSFQDVVDTAGDSRWLHRPAFDWDRAARRKDPQTIPGRIYPDLLRLVQVRQHNLALSRSETEFVESGNPHVFAFFRQNEGQSALVVANFSERPQRVEARRLRRLGLRRTFTDVLAGSTVVATDELTLEPYQLMVLVGIR